MCLQKYVKSLQLRTFILVWHNTMVSLQSGHKLINYIVGHFSNTRSHGCVARADCLNISMKLSLHLHLCFSLCFQVTVIMFSSKHVVV